MSGLQINSGLGFVSARPYIQSAQGIVTPEQSGPDVEVSLNAGEMEIVSGQGTFTIILAGQSITAAQQSVAAVDITKSLIGLLTTSQLGTIVTSLETDDTFVQSAQGAATNSTTVALNGLESTSATGTLTFVNGIPQAALSGSFATAQQQSIPALVVSAPLTGRSITATQGKFWIISLGGQEITSQQGEVFEPGHVARGNVPSSGGRIIGKRYRRPAELVRREAQELADRIIQYDVDLDPTQILGEVNRALHRDNIEEAETHVDRLKKMLKRAKERYEILKVIDESVA